MSLKTFLQSFGHWFTSLFESLDEAYKKEEPQFQAGMLTAATITQEIKENINEQPVYVWRLIQAVDTSLSENIIINAVQTVAAGIDSSIKIVTGDPVQTLGNIQAFLKTQTGNNRADKLQSTAKLLAAELLPGTPLEKISLFIQFVYTNFIQKH